MSMLAKSPAKIWGKDGISKAVALLIIQFQDAVPLPIAVAFKVFSLRPLLFKPRKTHHSWWWSEFIISSHEGGCHPYLLKLFWILKGYLYEAFSLKPSILMPALCDSGSTIHLVQMTFSSTLRAKNLVSGEDEVAKIVSTANQESGCPFTCADCSKNSVSAWEFTHQNICQLKAQCADLIRGSIASTWTSGTKSFRYIR